MHEAESSSDNPFLSLEQSRNETALRSGHFRVDNALSGPTEIVPIQAIEEADCRALRCARTPGSRNTGVKIPDQGALRHEPAHEPTPAPGSSTDLGDYFGALRHDTVKLSAWIDRDTAQGVEEHFTRLKREVDQDNERTVEAHDGTELDVKANSADDNRKVILDGGGVVVTAVAGPTVPWLTVKFRASWCWNHDLAELVQWARDFAELWGLKITGTLVSRLDLCTDVDERFYRSDMNRFGGQHRGNLSGTLTISDGRNGFTGLRYERSKHRPLTFRIYDKRAEVDSHDGRSFWPEVWDAHGVDEDSPVWRIEFEADRPRLRERGIDSWDDLTGEKIEAFWSYCTESFATMDRQVWDRAQEASTEDAAERADVEPQHDPERLKLQGLGAIKKAAEVEGRDVEEVMNDLQDEYL